jgi:hypothetical protein
MLKPTLSFTISMPSLARSRQAVARDNGAVPGGAALGCPRLGRDVDVHEAVALGVPFGPLDVVQQGPGEVAPQVYALCDGTVGRAQMPLQT